MRLIAPFVAVQQPCHRPKQPCRLLDNWSLAQIADFGDAFASPIIDFSACQ
jgi:hypothetical protein